MSEVSYFLLLELMASRGPPDRASVIEVMRAARRKLFDDEYQRLQEYAKLILGGEAL